MSTSYNMAFACIACRKSFKRAVDLAQQYPLVMPCPDCGAKTFNVGRHFKAPKKSDKAQWLKVAFLIQHGFWFQKIRSHRDSDESVSYPETLEQAKAFVVRYKQFALKGYELHV